MNKQKVTSNDVLEALSIRLNDTIRPNRSKEKKNNAYFWIFKFLFLLIYVFIIAIVLDAVRDLGVFTIYEIAKSLRSILSGLWIGIITTIKCLVILYLFYFHFKQFTSSDYYKTLYAKDKKMKKTKQTIEKVINVIFKIIAVSYIVVFGVFAVLSLIGFVYIICMLFDQMYILSLALIFLSIFGICVLLVKHLKKQYFEDEKGVSEKYVIALLCLLVFSVGFLIYETSSFDYSSSLPKGFKQEEKQVVFNINDEQKIYFDSDSKLDNIILNEDNSLNGQIRVEVTYYKTAKVAYLSTFNNKDDLKITITSDILLDKVDGKDLIKIFTSTINDRTIYNYNLFKYPNINIYANKKDFDRIVIK